MLDHFATHVNLQDLTCQHCHMLHNMFKSPTIVAHSWPAARVKLQLIYMGNSSNKHMHNTGKALFHPGHTISCCMPICPPQSPALSGQWQENPQKDSWDIYMYGFQFPKGTFVIIYLHDWCFMNFEKQGDPYSLLRLSLMRIFHGFPAFLAKNLLFTAIRPEQKPICKTGFNQ